MKSFAQISLLAKYKSLGMDMIWIMRDNTEIKFKDMSDSHIHNCISMLKKLQKNTVIDMWIYILEDVIQYRINMKLKRIINIRKNQQQ